MDLNRLCNHYYAAGMMDADGFFVLYPASSGAKSRRRESYYTASAVLEIRQEEVCRFMQDMYGGTVCKVKARKPEHSDTWKWVLKGSALDALLRHVRPLLKVKKDQAELLQEFRKIREGKNTSPITDEQQSKMEACRVAMNILNKKGPKNRQLIPGHVYNGNS